MSIRSIRLQIATVLLIGVVSSLHPAAARAADLESVHNFDIKAQRLETALIEFSQQADLQVLGATDTLAGAKTKGVSGELTSRNALNTLLQNTPVVFKPVGTHSIQIVPVGEKPVALYMMDGAQPLHLAQATTGTQQSAAAPESSSAKSGESGDSAAKEPEEVVITGRYEFLSSDTSGATNLPLPIEKVPQSISLISSDFLKAADLKTLGEIAEYTAGAVNAGTTEGFGSSTRLRGFDAGLAIDGLPLTGGGTYEPEYAIVDRLEVVKGPASVVYGVSQVGGLVNFVTKSATPRTPDYLSAQFGMWNNYRIEGQIAGALDSQGRVRAIGIAVRDQGDSFMHGVDHDTTVVYGGVNADLTDTVKAFLHAGYERHTRTAFDGIPTLLDGSPAPVPRSFFVGSPNMDIVTSVYHAEGDLTWEATDLLELNVKANYLTANMSGPGPYAFGLEPDGTIGLAIQDSICLCTDDYGLGVSGVYKLDSWGLKNSFVSLAALYQGSHTKQLAGQAIFQSTDDVVGIGNIFDGEDAIAAAFDAAERTGAQLVRQSQTKTLTISMQSVVQPAEHWSFLLGASHAKPTISNRIFGESSDSSIESQKSYRGGVIYELQPGTNAYVSYSESFFPQGGVDVNGNVLPPVSGQQYETGLKYRSVNGRLLLTGSVFRITEKNRRQFDQQVDGLDRFRAVGEVRNKGFEFEATGQLTRQWQVHAGYAYLDPKIVNDSRTQLIGQTVTFRAKQTTSVFSTYTFGAGPLQGLSVGGGARYMGSQRTSYSGATRDLPSYTIVDATMGYALKDWNFQLNAHNIFDKHYFVNNYQTLFYGNVVGTPANVSLTVQRQF